jgi:hypothetical protein
MTPIFIHLKTNGKHQGKQLVALTERNDGEWRFLYVNSETDEDVFSDKAYPSKQDAIVAATESQANPITFTEQSDVQD